MSEEIFRENAILLYSIVDKNISFFDDFKNPMSTSYIDYIFNVDILDTYKAKNPCLSSCYDLIKTLFTNNVTYIDHPTTIQILNNNCDKIIKIISAEPISGKPIKDEPRPAESLPTDIDLSNRPIPIVILNNFRIQKSNFFFALYFLYLYREKTEGQTIQLVSIGMFADRTNRVDTPLFNITQYIYEFNGLKTSNLVDSVFHEIKYLGIICDDFSYSGSQLGSFLFGYEIFNNDEIKVTMPDNFKLYINCIGCTKIALDRITNKIVNPECIIISDEIYNKQNLEVESIIRKTFSESERFADIYELLKYICLKHDVFILKKNHYGEIVIKSILFNFIKDYFLPKIYGSPFMLNNITMTYLFFKYPDFFSTLQNLCGFDLSNNEAEYYVISDIRSRIVNNYEAIIPLSIVIPPDIDQSINYEGSIEFNGFVGEFEIDKILSQVEIQYLIDNWDNLNGYEKNGLKIQKCLHNIAEKTQSLITNSNFTPITGNCQNSIEPFYKKIVWVNPFPTATTSPVFDHDDIVLDIIKTLKQSRSGNLKYSKYLKYKNKYLKLKKSLSKN